MFALFGGLTNGSEGGWGREAGMFTSSNKV